MPIEMARQPTAVRFPGAQYRLASGLCFCLILWGCGSDDPSLVPVWGIVTIDGEPLVDATVEFVPETGWGSQGKTDENGFYDLLYRAQEKGAPVGQHKVRISTEIEPDADSTNPEIQKGREELIPAKYNTHTTLKVQVEEGENMELHFDLKSGSTK
jgi:hypothetical protein